MVPRDYDGACPLPRYFGGLENLSRGLMRLGIDDNRRGRIEDDIKTDKSHHIEKISVTAQQVSEFWRRV